MLLMYEKMLRYYRKLHKTTIFRYCDSETAQLILYPYLLKYTIKRNTHHNQFSRKFDD